MTRLKNTAVIAFTAIGLLVGSGIAMADSHQAEKNDTVFNYGYDPVNQFLVWNISSLDYEVDETLLAESLFDSYQSFFDSCKLGPDEGDEPVVYGYTFDGDSVTLTLDGTPVEAPDGCEFLNNGGVVTGPNGQVNHGMFMKLFNSLYDGPHRGCLVRHLAHSDLGKTEDTKVKASAEYVAPEGEIMIGGDVVFTSEAADCIKGKKNDGDGSRGGPPDHVLEKKAERDALKWGEAGKPGKGPKK